MAYVPEGEVVGLSKIARTVEVFARPPAIAGADDGADSGGLLTGLRPKGVMVYVEAEHLCMTMRG